jgi:hypothetical protein
LKGRILASVSAGLAALLSWGCTTGIVSSTGRENSSLQSIVGPVTANLLNTETFCVDQNGLVIVIDTQNPFITQRSFTPTGLQSGERLVGIDFRPKLGVLYGLGSTGRMYYIDTNSGACFNVANAGVAVVPQQAQADIDFNPVVDRIRQVSGTQNTRLDPNTGTLVTNDGALNFAGGGGTPNVGACAYTENRVGATSTRLFVIDTDRNQLLEQIPPNAGTLVNPVNFPSDIGPQVGFDFSDKNVGYAAITPPGATRSTLFIIAPNTDAPITSFALFGHNVPIVSLAVRTGPDPNFSVVGVSDDRQLVRFKAGSPGTVSSVVALNGLLGSGNETVTSCDFRPANDALVVTTKDGTTARNYAVNLTSGAATLLGAAIPNSFDPIPTVPNSTNTTVDNVTAPDLNGAVGTDFNPTVDRLRVSNSVRFTAVNGTPATGSFSGNRRYSVDAGTQTIDPDYFYPFGDAGFVALNNLQPNTPNPLRGPLVAAPAYTNNFAGAVQTQMFAVDVSRDVLVTLPSPNNGETHTVGSLGVNTDVNCGMDVGPFNLALISYHISGDAASRLGVVNTQTGRVTEVGVIGNVARIIRDIAIVPPGL